MLIGAPDKYECASCRKKFVSQLRPPIRLPRVMGEEKTGCECLTYGDIVIHVCHRRKNPSPFKGSEWACSNVCYLALTGESPPVRKES